MCGGTRTEHDYFSGLQHSALAESAAVTIRSKAVAPHQLVELVARQALHERAGHDESWCVVDTDEFDIARAVASADRSGVRIAVSNPCFEVWLLLHHAERTAPLAGADDAVAAVRRHVPEYRKAGLRFVDFEDGVRDATERARKLDGPAGVPPPNPSSGVWRLVARIVGEEER